MKPSKPLSDIFTIVAASREETLFGLASRFVALQPDHVSQLRGLLSEALEKDEQTQQNLSVRETLVRAQAQLARHDAEPETKQSPVYNSWVMDPIDAAEPGAVKEYRTYSNDARDSILKKMQRGLYRDLKKQLA